LDLFFNLSCPVYSDSIIWLSEYINTFFEGEIFFLIRQVCLLIAMDTAIRSWNSEVLLDGSTDRYENSSAGFY
jgi:hypothetical protein